MKLLLDTQLLIWVSLRPSRLSLQAQELMVDPHNNLVFSTISIWEIAIKYALGRKEFDIEPRVLRRGLLDHGYEELEFRSDHALAVGSLPPLHKDPFDRALVAQAISEELVLLSADRVLQGYSGVVRKV